jgi:uncharacterized tellurite resistance protein B-like protein
MSEQNELIADLLMGAALADKHLDGRELDAVKELLAEAMGVEQVPMAMLQRLDGFDADKFDLKKTAGALELDDAEKRNLLELVAAVHEADDAWDFDEDDYLKQLGLALGMAEEAFSDLTLQDLVIEDVGKKLLKPPPLPKKD